MAKQTVSVVLGSGADDRATSGKFAVRRVVSGADADQLNLAVWKEYVLGTEPTPIEVEVGVLYVSKEVVPAGGEARYWYGPVDATNYKDLEFIIPLPAAPGILGDTLIDGVLSNPASEAYATLEQFVIDHPGPQGATGPTGAPGGSDASFAGFVGTPGTLTEGAVAAKITDALADFEGGGESILGQLFALPMFVAGHSYVAGNGAATPSARWFERLAARQHMGAITNAGIAGHTVGDIAMCVLGGAYNWAPRTKAHIELLCAINDLTIYGNGAASQRGFGHATRALLSRFTADAVVAADTPTFVYTGTGWATVGVPVISAPTSTPAGGAVGSTSGVQWRTTTVGDYVDVAVTSDAADIMLIARAAGAGLVTAKVGATTVGTLDLTAATAQDTPAPMRVAGLGAGTHTVRLTLTSGASMTVDSVNMVSTTPPIGAVIAEGDILASAGTLGPGSTGTYLDAMQQFRVIQQAIVADFPSFAWVDIDASPLWTGAPDLFYDGKHPNDKGSQIMSELVEAALGAFGYSASMNVLGPAPTAYAPVASPLSYGSKNGAGKGGPALSKLSGTSIRVDWSLFTPPAGTTSYTIRYRIGAGSWTDVASAGTGTTKDLTGLTTGQVYDIQVAPVVSGTTGTYSLSSTQYIGTIYDDFNRTDLTTLGVTSVGGEVWSWADPTGGAGKWGTNGTIAMPTDGANVSIQLAHLNLYSPDVSVETKVTQVQSTSGLIVRYVDARNYVYSLGTALYLRSGSSGVGTGTLLAGTAGVIATNDVMKIVTSGTTITLFRNGTQIAQATGVTAGQTSTRHGLMANYHATETSRSKFDYFDGAAA